MLRAKDVLVAFKLYVGNLNYKTQTEDLQSLFAQYGEVVSANVVTDRETGRSRGFGFVEMETEEAAKEAIEKMNGREVNQRNLKVDEANPPRERSFGGGGRKSGGRGGYDRRR